MSKENQLSNEGKEPGLSTVEESPKRGSELKADPEETAFETTLNAWEAKSARDRRMLSPQRFFFHAGYSVVHELVDALAEVRDRHDEKAKRCNFSGCGCDYCAALESALSLATTPEE